MLKRVQVRLESKSMENPLLDALEEYDDRAWKAFEREAIKTERAAGAGEPGWAWAEDYIADLLDAVPNGKKGGDGGIDARYYGVGGVMVPIQAKMHQAGVSRAVLDELLGVQTREDKQKGRVPMSVLITLYPSSSKWTQFATGLGTVDLRDADGGTRAYPVMQLLSVKEMLVYERRPNLPPIDARWIEKYRNKERSEQGNLWSPDIEEQMRQTAGATDQREDRAKGPLHRKRALPPKTIAGVRRAFARYCGEVETSGLTASTKRTYLLHAGNFVKWLDGSFRPGERLR